MGCVPSNKKAYERKNDNLKSISDGPTKITLPRKRTSPTEKYQILGYERHPMLDNRDEFHFVGVTEKGKRNGVGMMQILYNKVQTDRTYIGLFTDDEITGIAHIVTNKKRIDNSLECDVREIYHGQMKRGREHGFGIEQIWGFGDRRELIRSSSPKSAELEDLAQNGAEGNENHVGQTSLGNSPVLLHQYKGYYDEGAYSGFGMENNYKAGWEYIGSYLHGKRAGWGEERLQIKGGTIVYKGYFEGGEKHGSFIKTMFHTEKMDSIQYLTFYNDIQRSNTVEMGKMIGIPFLNMAKKSPRHAYIRNYTSPGLQNIGSDYNFPEIHERSFFSFDEKLDLSFNDNCTFAKCKVKFEIKEKRNTNKIYHGKGYFCNSFNLAYYAFYEYYIYLMIYKIDINSRIYLRNVKHLHLSVRSLSEEISTKYEIGVLEEDVQLGSNAQTSNLSPELQVLSLLYGPNQIPQNNLENIIARTLENKELGNLLTEELAEKFSILLIKGLKELEDYGVFHCYIRPKHLFAYWYNGRYALKLTNFSHVHYLHLGKIVNRSTIFVHPSILSSTLLTTLDNSLVPELEGLSLETKENQGVFDSEIFPFEYSVLDGDLHYLPPGMQSRVLDPFMNSQQLTTHSVKDTDIFAAGVTIFSLYIVAYNNLQALAALKKF